MSDEPQGDGWWQTSDGKWHPPDYDPTAPGGGSTAPETATPPPPPHWSPSGTPGPASTPQDPAAPQWGEPAAQDPGSGGDATSGLYEPTAAPQETDPGGVGAPDPQAPLFGQSGPEQPTAAQGTAQPGATEGGDNGPFTTHRPGEFGLPSEPRATAQPQPIGGGGMSGGGTDDGSGTPRAVLWGGVAAAVLVVLAAGWFFFVRDSGSDVAEGEGPEPTVASETTLADNESEATTEEDAAATTASTTAPLPPKPTIAPGERLPPLEFSGDGDSTVSVDPPGPRTARISFTGSGPFTMTGLDANGSEVATFAEAEGPYSGTVAVDFRDEQDSRSLRVEADGPWTIEMEPVEALVPLEGTFTGSGDNVVLYTGGVGPVTITHSGSGPITVNYFEIRTRNITTVLDETGPVERSVELRGPAFVWIQADGDWSVTPG